MDSEDEIKNNNYPESYYNLTSKERLLLLFAENLRRQYRVKYENRKPCVLAVKNECEIEVKIQYLCIYLYCNGLTFLLKYIFISQNFRNLCAQQYDQQLFYFRN